MDHQVLSKTRLFEKIEIDWFSYADMRRNIKKFRGFYQDIVELFFQEKENIQNFVLKNKGKSGITRRYRGTRKHDPSVKN
jgi:transposase-like protein